MTRPILHFSHANSYPAGTYQAFFRLLSPHYDVRALPLHAHNPRYPVRDGWEELAQELVDELRQRYREPVILVGHSLGGMLAMMAAHRHPELARCVVLLDSPVLAGWRACFLRVAKLVGADMKFSPARVSMRRREHWAGREAAYQHYATKDLFASWPAEVLQDYVEHGTEPVDAGVRLRFSRDIETAIYRTLPHHLGRLARRRFPVPIGFIGGDQSIECRHAGLTATRRLVGPHFRQIPGGHLFPMENPEQAALALHQLIQSLLPR